MQIDFDPARNPSSAQAALQLRAVAGGSGARRARHDDLRLGDWLGFLRGGSTAVGRMPLTNYLFETVACVLIFEGFGLGLFGATATVRIAVRRIRCLGGATDSEPGLAAILPLRPRGVGLAGAGVLAVTGDPRARRGGPRTHRAPALCYVRRPLRGENIELSFAPEGPPSSARGGSPVNVRPCVACPTLARPFSFFSSRSHSHLPRRIPVTLGVDEW